MTSLAVSIHGTEIRKKVQKGLSANLLRAMQVAGSRDDGKPMKLSQQLLSDTSGVARSTISKYLNNSLTRLRNRILSTPGERRLR